MFVYIYIYASSTNHICIYTHAATHTYIHILTVFIDDQVEAKEAIGNVTFPLHIALQSYGVDLCLRACVCVCVDVCVCVCVGCVRIRQEHIVCVCVWKGTHKRVEEGC